MVLPMNQTATVDLAIVRRSFTILFLLLAAVASLTYGSPADAANRYVRQGASGSGTSWSDAYGSLPASLVRGDTYYVADGSYGSYTFDDPVAGTTPITIRKCTDADHGTETGYSAAYCDGQATFGELIMVTNYYVIDGAKRNESNWQDTASYGFRLRGVTANTLSFGAGSSHVAFRHVDVGGPNGTTFTGSEGDAFYLGGFGSVLSNWTVSRAHIHNMKLAFQIAGADSIVIEYSHMGPGWQKETIRGQVRASNITIRHNVLRDACQGLPSDPTAGACTAQIGMWDGGAGAFDGSKIYGNVISMTKSTAHTDGCIFIGGDGNVTAAGAAANNVAVFNNTFAGIQQGTCNIRFPGSHSGDIAQNNIWYGLGSGVSTGCSANTCTNNVVIGSNIFVNAAGGNFRLAQATAPGNTLSSPFNIDKDGAARGADGVWDLGAFEFSATGVKTPQAPTAVIAD
jgi:hypothetical protein